MNKLSGITFNSFYYFTYEKDIVYSHSGKSWAVSYKVKHICTMWPSNSTLRYLPKRSESLCSQQTLYSDASSSCIHNCTKLKVTQVSFSGWMDKQTVIHTVEYSSAAKRKIIKTRNNLDESQRHFWWMTSYMTKVIRHFWKDKTIVTENRSMGYQWSKVLLYKLVAPENLGADRIVLYPEQQ